MANLQWSFAIGVGGGTQSVSFAIFSFKYFEASKTITLSKNGIPYREQQRYLKQVQVIREVLIVNLSLAWFLLNFYFYEAQVQKFFDGDQKLAARLNTFS